MSGDVSVKNDPMISFIEGCREDASACMLTEDEFVEQYRGALDGLAFLDFDFYRVDSADLEALSEPQNMDIVADLITSNPAYRLLRQRRQALEFGARGVAASGHSPAIPEEHYAWLVYLVQAGLRNTVAPDLAPTGVFDEETKEAAYRFQSVRGIDGRQGGIIGAETMEALAGEIRFDLAGIRKKLTDVQDLFLKGTEPFYINGEDNKDIEERDFIRSSLVDVMLWAGAMNRRSDLSDPRGKEELQTAIESYLGKKVDIVGRYTVAEVMKKIDNEHPVTEGIR